MVLWNQMGDKCAMALETSYWDLLLLFKINVILLSVSFFVFLCIICLGAAFIGGAVATGGASDGAQRDLRSLFFWRQGGPAAQGSADGSGLDKALRTAAMQVRRNEPNEP
jgi:hypothetical protein